MTAPTVKELAAEMYAAAMKAGGHTYGRAPWGELAPSIREFWEAAADHATARLDPRVEALAQSIATQAGGRPWALATSSLRDEFRKCARGALADVRADPTA